jgi:DNA-binding transcriptional LysR family regulator
MEMHQVRYFIAICETGTFTRGAQQCGVAQPSLTKALRKLEEELGGPLFHRERKGVVLTELGQRLRPHLKALHDAEEAALQDAAEFHLDDREQIRLGAMTTIAPARMTGFLKRLYEQKPTLGIEVSEGPVRTLIDQMLDGDLDAALLAFPTLPPALREMPLYRERYMIAFGAGHAFEARNAVAIAELDGADYLQRLHCEFSDHYRALGWTRPISARVRYSSEREDWVQSMVAAGFGCSIMPEFLPRVEGVCMRPLCDPEIARTVSLVTVAGRPHGAALSALIRSARRYPWPGSGATAIGAA